jgi:hypothetical protein
MKERTCYIILLTSIILSLAACEKETGFAESEGSLKLSIGVSDKVDVVSRSLSEEEQAILGQDCKIRIYSGETLVQKYQGIDNVPEQIQLVSGDYSVRVTAGDSVAASFEQRFFEGKKDFSIEKGTTSTVEVNCGIANTVVAIAWDESLKEIFKEDYQVTVTSSTGELVYSSANANAKGYFNLPEDNRKLTCKFSATTLGGKTYESSSELSDLSPATLYNLTYSYKETEIGPIGGAALNIKVEEVPLGDTYTITLKQRPVIVCKDVDGQSYDLEQPMYLELNTQVDYSIQVSTSSALTSLIFRNERFTEWGGSDNELDILTLNEQDTEAWKNVGISVSEKKQSLNGDVYTICFAKDLMAKMTAKEGSVETSIEAVDAEGKSRVAVWNVVASDATVKTSETKPYEVWTSKATLHGEILRDMFFTPKFRYRVKTESSEWIMVDADLSEKSFSKEIKGLTPGTTYEYQAMDGEQVSSVTCEFTTETEFQPENAGFEYTSGSSPIVIYGGGQQMWWDTGNHGSASMGKNVTTPDTSVKHSGNQSILLSSQFVGLAGILGKFAAGNLFAGKYLKTDGTDGVLGWGRPCISRPKALKVWVRYEPGTVDNGGSYIANGATDQGIIYVAVGDWTGQEGQNDDGGVETWPFVVKTKNSESLFSTDKGTYSGDGTIAYGERVFTEAYKDGTNLKELTIDLDYDNYGGVQRKPTSIIIVASASRYGDYFQGSEASKMWLDDMELIYE